MDMKNLKVKIKDVLKFGNALEMEVFQVYHRGNGDIRPPYTLDGGFACKGVNGAFGQLRILPIEMGEADLQIGREIHMEELLDDITHVNGIKLEEYLKTMEARFDISNDPDPSIVLDSEFGRINLCIHDGAIMISQHRNTNMMRGDVFQKLVDFVNEHSTHLSHEKV
jgi:hypothetical protein